MTLPVPVPRPSYSQARENLVKAIPPKIICLLACGGWDCRYEGPACWRPGQQAIQGVFSSWVTDDIIAMARPSTHLIKRYGIIEQFQRLNIRSIINMQLPGEHAHCGPPLDPDSGFSYSPQVFMENQSTYKSDECSAAEIAVFFLNFGMPDFGVSSLSGMLDAVKGLAFAVKEGKVAVHCHAGLGRTGVLIACYLIYTLRVSPSEAVHYVRIKRPRSIQTRAQIDLVFSFAHMLASQLVQYPDPSHRHGAPFSLQQYLQRQSLLLHGEEARRLKGVPKIVNFLCRRLVAVALGRSHCPGGRAELEKRETVLDLTKTVRDTLVTKKFLPILWDPGHTRKPLLDSVWSWDEPEGFLERKREVLLNRRSYSDSDLRKIALFEGLELDGYPTLSVGIPRDRGTQEQTSAGAVQDQSNGHVCAMGVPEPAPRIPADRHRQRRAKCLTKKAPAFAKFTSNRELQSSQNTPRAVAVSQSVAKALADQDPPGEDILHRAALLQEELNGDECAWATLAKEPDPVVLSALLWIWLEKLREPILNAEDVDRLNRVALGQVVDLRALHKAQEKTVTCMLRCISQVTSLCPWLEDVVVGRLVRALTRCPREELVRHASLITLFKGIIKGMRGCDSFTGETGRPLSQARVTDEPAVATQNR